MSSPSSRHSGTAEISQNEGPFTQLDLHRLDSVIRAARRASTASTASLITPSTPSGQSRLMAHQNCVFDHCTVLLFPQTSADGLAELQQRGLNPLPPIPSTAVRRRLAERYGFDAAECAIDITRLRLHLPDGRIHPAVEVFLLPHDRNKFAPVVEKSETRNSFENHTAFVVPRPSNEVLAHMISVWQAEAGLIWEGGMHNPHEGPDGSTVLYFVREHADPARPRRIELNCGGDLRNLIDWLPPDTEAIERAYSAW